VYVVGLEMEEGEMVAEDEGVSESISWSHLSAWHKWGELSRPLRDGIDVIVFLCLPCETSLILSISL
jgi:hypothetical protein